MHAEAVLLVDHREAEVAERDVLLEQRVGAEDDVDLAGCDAPASVGCARRALVAAGEQGDAQARRLGQRREPLKVLAGEDLGRRHQRRLRGPLSTTLAMASSATTVLPEPTSPCSRRSMRSGAARSRRISSTAVACAPVSE